MYTAETPAPVERRQRLRTVARPLTVALCLSSLALMASAEKGQDSFTAGLEGKHQGGGDATIQSGLRNTSDLIGKCFNFPTSDFSPDNCIMDSYPNDPTPLLERGDFAIDFVLPTVDDEIVRLRHLLKSKPVVLIYGTNTCPAFQGYYLESHQESHFSKYDQWALVDKYHHDFHFVNLYSVEPHPFAPDTNFDTGVNVEYEWSSFRQPRTFKNRNFFVKKIANDLHEKTILLIDNLGNTRLPELQEVPDYNPVWCTYGPGSRMAFLIGQDGKLYNVQAWFHATTMAGAMEELLMLSRTPQNHANTEQMLKKLETKRELAYAQMEIELSRTLERFNQTDRVYQPTEKSVQMLQVEASSRIDSYVNDEDYTQAKAALYAENQQDDPRAENSRFGVHGPVAKGVGLGAAVAGLVALAVVTHRRKQAGHEGYSKVPESDLAI